MSLFGAMTTAVSGLDAQSAAFTNISDNTANSSTIGYKGVDTSFLDLLTQSTATQNVSGSVATRPDYLNEVQGSIQQVSDPLALAISGQGFFAVSQQTESGNQPVAFSGQTQYTRAGDFTLDKNGYLVNSAGLTLEGYTINPVTGGPNTSALVPLHVSTAQLPPTATSQVAIDANVPATPSPTSNLSSEVQIFDASGTPHQLTTSWAQTGPNAWTLTLGSPDNAGGPTIGTVNVAFNPNGTLASLSGGSGGVTVNGTGGTASVQVTPTFGATAQPLTLTLGQFGVAGGVTQYAGTDYALSSATQNGAPAGNFTGASVDASGDVVASYDNSQTLVVGHVPVVTFANADALQRQNGQAFTQTVDSGPALVQNAGQNGAGTLVAGSVEQSNVDIATELSKMIVAQQAYGANAKVISTGSQMLLSTLNIIQ